METTQQVLATERLEAAEARARAAADRINAVLESTSDCVFVLDRHWCFSFMNQRAIEEVAGGRDLTGCNIWEEYPHAVGSAFWDNYQHAMNKRETASFEAYYPPPLANWYEVEAYPSEEGIAVFFRNINQRRAAEEHQRLLINELNHRVKNTLATVQALASQVQRSTQTPKEAHQSFMARLQALAAAHDVLTHENWQSADLIDLVSGVTNLYQDRIRVHGSSVRLAPRAALSLAMAFHELATNAAKYGALSNDTGSVQIRWSVGGEPANQHLDLDWWEQSGPLVLPPTRRGFGSRLIKRSLTTELGGSVEMVYDPAGLRCAIRLPLDTGPTALFA
jgi:two-component sensor histidine kinase